MRKVFLIILASIYSCSESLNYEYVIKDEDFRVETLKTNPGNYIELENGFTYYEEANEHSDLGTVVLVHGFSVPSYILENIFNSIEDKGFRVIMMDLFGRGFSDNPDLPQTDELRANQVIELLDKRNIKNASLVGLSNGGRIISKIAYLKPEIINELFYIASSGFYEYPDTNDRDVGLDEINDLIKSYPEMALGQKNDFFNPGQYPDWIDKYQELQKHKGFARALISTTKNLVTLDYVHNKIDSLNIPVYTFWGEFDKVVVYDEFKNRLNRVLPNRMEFFISNSGHLPHMENQDEFESIFFKYLNSNK
jgi:pimeloyl-ACP methyl ester carboxylesterase